MKSTDFSSLRSLNSNVKIRLFSILFFLPLLWQTLLDICLNITRSNMMRWYSDVMDLERRGGLRTRRDRKEKRPKIVQTSSVKSVRTSLSTHFSHGLIYSNSQRDVSCSIFIQSIISSKLILEPTYCPIWDITRELFCCCVMMSITKSRALSDKKANLFALPEARHSAPWDIHPKK